MGGQIIEKGQYVARTNGFMMEPLGLFIVGIDTAPGESAPAGPHDPRYDARVQLPVDTALALSLIQEGNLQPVQCRKDGTTLEVVYGRQRVRAARWANEQIEAHWAEIDGKAPAGTCTLPEHLRQGLERDDRVYLKVEITRADARRALAAMVAENAHRRQDDLVTTARKLDQYLSRAHTWAQAKVTFGFRQDHEIQALLWILDLSETAQKALTTGRMSRGGVAILRELPRDTQDKVIAGIEGTLTPARLRAGVESVLGKPTAPKAAKPKPAASTRPGLPEHFGLLEQVHTLLEEDTGLDEPHFDAPSEDVLLLKWVVGRVSTAEVAKYIPWLPKALAAAAAAKPAEAKDEPAVATAEPADTDADAAE